MSTALYPPGHLLSRDAICARLIAHGVRNFSQDTNGIWVVPARYVTGGRGFEYFSAASMRSLLINLHGPEVPPALR